MVTPASKSGTQPRAEDPISDTSASKIDTNRVISNVEALDEWLATFGADASARCGVQIALARTLATQVDDEDGQGYCEKCHRSGTGAPLAKIYAAVFESLAGLLEAEGVDDGEAAARERLRTPVRLEAVT